MAYSYGGWQDEFKGLSKENKFSGSAFEDNTDDKEEVFRPTKRPTGLGTKVVVEDASGGEDDTSGNENDVYAVVKQMLGGNDSLVAPKASNLTTGKNTELYLAQQDNKIKKQLSYLKQINNINIQKDILNVDENEPTEVSIFRAVTAGRNLTTDASITSTLPNGDKLTIYDNAKVRNGAGNTVVNNVATGLGFEEVVPGLQDLLLNLKDSFGNPVLVDGGINELTGKPIVRAARSNVNTFDYLLKLDNSKYEYPSTANLEAEYVDILNYNTAMKKEFSGPKPSVIEVLKEMYRQVTTDPITANILSESIEGSRKLVNPAFSPPVDKESVAFKDKLTFEAGLTKNPALSTPSVEYNSTDPNAIIGSAKLGYDAGTDAASLNAAGQIGEYNYGAAVDNRGDFGLQINRHLDSFNKPIIYGGFDTDQNDTKFNIGIEWSLGGK